jgi:hypothetical protein
MTGESWKPSPWIYFLALPTPPVSPESLHRASETREPSRTMERSASTSFLRSPASFPPPSTSHSPTFYEFSAPGGVFRADRGDLVGGPGHVAPGLGKSVAVLGIVGDDLSSVAAVLGEIDRDPIEHAAATRELPEAVFEAKDAWRAGRFQGSERSCLDTVLGRFLPRPSSTSGSVGSVPSSAGRGSAYRGEFHRR